MTASVFSALVAPMLSTAALAETVDVAETAAYVTSVQACPDTHGCQLVHLQHPAVEALWVVQQGSCKGDELCVGKHGRVDYIVERQRFGSRSISRYFYSAGPSEGLVDFYEVHRLVDGDLVHEYGLPTQGLGQGYYAQLTPPEEITLDDLLGTSQTPTSLFDQDDAFSTDISMLGDYLDSSFQDQFQMGMDPLTAAAIVTGLVVAGASAYAYYTAADGQFDNFEFIEDALDNSSDNTVTDADAAAAADQVRDSQGKIARGAHAPWASPIFGSSPDLFLPIPEDATLEDLERILSASSKQELEDLGL